MDTNLKKKHTYSKWNQTWSGKTFGLFFSVGLFLACFHSISCLQARARAVSRSFVRFGSMWLALFLYVVHSFIGHISDDNSTYAHINKHTVVATKRHFFFRTKLYARSPHLSIHMEIYFYRRFMAHAFHINSFYDLWREYELGQPMHEFETLKKNRSLKILFTIFCKSHKSHKQID